MREKNMKNPNMLGHYHRDIVKAEFLNRYYVYVTLSCGHSKTMSRAGFKKNMNSATLCIDCGR